MFSVRSFLKGPWKKRGKQLCIWQSPFTTYFLPLPLLLFTPFTHHLSQIFSVGAVLLARNLFIITLRTMNHQQQQQQASQPVVKFSINSNTNWVSTNSGEPSDAQRLWNDLESLRCGSVSFRITGDSAMVGFVLQQCLSTSCGVRICKYSVVQYELENCYIRSFGGLVSRKQIMLSNVKLCQMSWICEWMDGWLAGWLAVYMDK